MQSFPGALPLFLSFRSCPRSAAFLSFRSCPRPAYPYLPIVRLSEFTAVRKRLSANSICSVCISILCGFAYDIVSFVVTTLYFIVILGGGFIDKRIMNICFFKKIEFVRRLI